VGGGAFEEKQHLLMLQVTPQPATLSKTIKETKKSVI
jgi:hypothetical protein